MMGQGKHTEFWGGLPTNFLLEIATDATHDSSLTLKKKNLILET